MKIEINFAYQLALLSKQVNTGKKEYTIDWKCTNDFNNDEGLVAAAYEKSNIVVIAFGTKDSRDLQSFIKNLKLSYEITTGIQPNVCVNALEFAKRSSQHNFLNRLINFFTTFKFKQLYLTGNGPGGIIAGVVGWNMLMKGLECNIVTFENPGYSHFLYPPELELYKQQYETRFTTFLSNPNLWNTFNSHLGKVIRVHCKKAQPNLFSSPKQYAKNIIEALSNDILRIIFLLLTLNYMIVLFSGNETFSEKLFSAIDSVHQLIGNKLNLLPISSTDQAKDTLFLLQFIAYPLTWKILSNVFNATNYLHNLEGVLNQLSRDNDNSLCEVQWPSRTQYFTTKGYQLLTWMNPLNHASLITINNLVELEERQIKNSFGYKEKPKI